MTAFPCPGDNSWSRGALDSKLGQVIPWDLLSGGFLKSGLNSLVWLQCAKDAPPSVRLNVFSVCGQPFFRSFGTLFFLHQFFVFPSSVWLVIKGNDRIHLNLLFSLFWFLDSIRWLPEEWNKVHSAVSCTICHFIRFSFTLAMLCHGFLIWCVSLWCIPTIGALESPRKWMPWLESKKRIRCVALPFSILAHRWRTRVCWFKFGQNFHLNLSNSDPNHCWRPDRSVPIQRRAKQRLQMRKLDQKKTWDKMTHEIDKKGEFVERERRLFYLIFLFPQLVISPFNHHLSNHLHPKEQHSPCPRSILLHHFFRWFRQSLPHLHRVALRSPPHFQLDGSP